VRYAISTRETPEQRQSRLQWEAEAAKGSVPGRRGARVYYWDDVNGFHIHRAAGCPKYVSLWDDYADRQRRYDSFNNEWDLCEAFAPNDHPDTDSEEDSIYDPSDPIPLLDDDSHHPPDHNEKQFLSASDLK
jgi:hypothetical protein